MNDTHSPSGLSPAEPGGLQRRAKELERGLADLVRDLVRKRKAAAGIRAELPVKSLELRLDIPINGQQAPPPDQLYREVERAVGRCVDSSAPVPPGHVYCHWCRSFECEHSSPPESRSVFGGYTPTGQPKWPELVSVLLQKRHPRVDAIFQKEPIALVQDGGELIREQLPIYGKGSPICRLLGQVALGYLPYPEALSLPHGQGTGRGPLAITFQAVEAGTQGAPMVLNVLGRLPGGGHAYQALEESDDARIGDAIVSARRALEELVFLKGRQARNGERRGRALRVLSRLAKNLERIFRQRRRRTLHSEDRHLDRQRPASSALHDALHANREAIFRDVEERTWVILGPRNRVHVFNDAALHVTSVVYPGETVHQRTTRGKWRTPPAEEMTAFQEALRRRARVGEP